jgi:hypothetical protein
MIVVIFTGGTVCRVRMILDTSFAPHLEATPIVFARCAHLVGEAEVVLPALLDRAPATAPDELERSGLRSRVEAHRADEIRASGSPIHRYSVDVELGGRGEHMLDEAGHLDVRRVPLDVNVVRVTGVDEPAHVRLEFGRCRGLVQELVDLAWRSRPKIA